MAIDPFVPAGSLRYPITILDKSITTDVSGTTATYVPILSTRANILPIRGTDMIRAGQNVTQTFITVIIRYRPGILAEMRVQAPHGLYEIQSVVNIGERNRRLELTCLALGNNA